MKQKPLIISAFKKHPSYSDRQIATYLIQTLTTFKHCRLDSLRRQVGDIRDDNHIPRQRRDREALDRDIKDYIKRYPETSAIALAHKLRLLHPKYSVNSIRTLIYEAKHWQIATSRRNHRITAKAS